MPTPRVEALLARLEKGGHKTQEALGALAPEGWSAVVYREPHVWDVRDVLAHLLSAEQGLLRMAQDVAAGAALLAADEEKGILDLVLAHPVSRTALFWGRWLAFAAATTLILLLGWAGWVPFAHRVGLNLTWLQFLLPNVPLLAELLLFGSLALLLSMLLPASANASALVGALLTANWLLRGLAAMNKDLMSVMKWTPLHFYQSGAAVDGLNWGWLAGLLGASLLLAGLAWVLFQRRDIRVGGERSWTLPAQQQLPVQPEQGERT